MKGFIISIGSKIFTEVDVSDQIESNISFEYWEEKHYSLFIATNSEKFKKTWKSCFFDRLDDIKITRTSVLQTKGPILETPLGDFVSIEDFDNAMEGSRRIRNDPDCDSRKYSVPFSKLNSISITSGEKQLTNIPVQEYRFLSIYIRNFALNNAMLEIQALRKIDDSGNNIEYVPLETKLDLIYSSNLESKDLIINLTTNNS